MSHLVQRLGHLGDGITQSGLYAPRALPGEVIDGVIDGDTFQKPRILQPSDQRIAPLCSAYKRCGSCALQHAKDDFIKNWKAQVVRNAFAAHGITAQISAVHTSPAHSRRRAKLSGRRMKNAAVVGFHERASQNVHSAAPCMVLTKRLAGLIPALEDFTKRYGSRRKEVSFWLLDTKTGIDVAIDAIPLPQAHAQSEIALWAQRSGICRLSMGDEIIAEATAPFLQVGPALLTPPPRAFAQATQEGEHRLQALVLRAIRRAQCVVDLFAGFGTFALCAAQQAQVLAAEADAPLLKALGQAARHTAGLKPIKTQVRDLFKNPLNAQELALFDAAIIDPPRAGAQAQVAQIAQSQVSCIAMVSCHPVSFARDVHTLIQAEFTLEWIEVVDQFRWSPHIEIVAALTRK